MFSRASLSASHHDLLPPGELFSLDELNVIHQLLDAIPDAAAAYTPYFHCLTFNEAWLTMLETHTGMRLQRGQNAQKALEYFCEEPNQLYDNWTRVLHGEHFTVLCEFEPLHDQHHVYDIAYRPLRDEDGQPIGVIQIFRNVSSTQAMTRNQVYRMLTHPMAEGAIVYDANLIVREANTHAEQLFGRTRTELINTPIGDGLIDEQGTPLSLESHPAAIVLRTKHPVSGITIGVYRPDGTFTWTIVNAWLIAPQLIGRSNVVMVSFTPHPEQFSLLTSMLNTSLEGIMTFKSIRDHDGQLVDFELTKINLQAAKMINHSTDQLIGQRLNEVAKRYRHLGIFERYKQVVETGVSSTEERWYDQESFGRWLYSKVVRVDDGCAVLLRDMTQHRKAEEAQLALVSAKIGTWEIDLLTGNVHRTAMTDQFFGYPFDTTLRSIDEYLQRVHPDDVERLRRLLFRAAALFMHDVEFRIMHSDDHVRWVSLRGRIVEGHDNQPLRMIGTLTDITERIQLEARARHSQRLANIGRLTGGVAHDFNNLLTALIGYTELVYDSLEDNHPARDDLREVQKAADRAIGLTRQLLAFARRQPLAIQTINLNALIGNTERLLQRLLSEDIEMILRLTQDVQSIRADPGQIEQVIINLAVNARDAMPNGGKLVITTENVLVSDYDTALRTALQPGPYVLFTVSDTGVGMSKHVQQRIFEPFFTTKGHDQGTGLGMATCNEIIKHHGGHITIHSELGRGTTINVYVPASISEERTYATTQLPHKALPRGTETIVLVEDDSDVRTLQARVLQESGYTVLQARNGVEALELISTHGATKIDLLITDIVMPQMSGLDLASMLQELVPELRTILMSGYADHMLTQPGRFVKDTPFLAKPQLASTLLQRVREVLDGR